MLKSILGVWNTILETILIWKYELNGDAGYVADWFIERFNNFFRLRGRCNLNRDAFWERIRKNIESEVDYVERQDGFISRIELDEYDKGLPSDAMEKFRILNPKVANCMMNQYMDYYKANRRRMNEYVTPGEMISKDAQEAADKLKGYIGRWSRICEEKEVEPPMFEVEAKGNVRNDKITMMLLDVEVERRLCQVGLAKKKGLPDKEFVGSMKKRKPPDKWFAGMILKRFRRENTRQIYCDALKEDKKKETAR
jgi:hypothetical protein